MAGQIIKGVITERHVKPNAVNPGEYEYRILVHIEDDAGQSYAGYLPKSIRNKQVGDWVEFTASVEVNFDDPDVLIFRRPRKVVES